MGLYRAPIFAFMIEESYLDKASDWSLILMVYILTTEGFVVVAAVSWYFGLFRRWKESWIQGKLIVSNSGGASEIVITCIDEDKPSISDMNSNISIVI